MKPSTVLLAAALLLPAVVRADPLTAPFGAPAGSLDVDTLADRSLLFGPDTSFAGNSQPTTDWLSGRWPDDHSVQTMSTANILSMPVSAVPELPSGAMMAAGLAALALLARTLRRRRLAPAPA